MLRLLVHDYDASELVETVAALRGALPPAVHIDEYQSRNEFLGDISRLPAPKARALALIDLRSHEAQDPHFRGLRLIETIARHPTLARRAHPIALTRHSYHMIQDLLDRSGARAAIDKRVLDRPTADLSQDLEAVAADDNNRSPHTPWIGSTPATPGDDEAAIAAAFAELFGDLPWTDNRLLVLDAQLAGLKPGDAIESLSMAYNTFHTNERLLAERAHPRFVAGDGVARLPAAASMLFERAPQAQARVEALKRRLGGLTENLRDAAPPQRVVHLQRNADVVRDSWLDAEARNVLQAASQLNEGSWADRIDRIAEGKSRAERRAMSRALARAVTALVEADTDRLEQGR